MLGDGRLSDASSENAHTALSTSVSCLAQMDAGLGVEQLLLETELEQMDACLHLGLRARDLLPRRVQSAAFDSTRGREHADWETATDLHRV